MDIWPAFHGKRMEVSFMTDYMFICKDEKTNLAYYYKFDLDLVYVMGNDLTGIVEERRGGRKRAGSWIGAAIGILLYALFGKFEYSFLPVSILYGAAALVGSIVAAIGAALVKRKVLLIFTVQNGIEIREEEKRELLALGRRFSSKYKVLEWGLGIFLVIADVILILAEAKSLILMLSTSCLWGIFIFMILIYDPRDYERLKRCWKIKEN